MTLTAEQETVLRDLIDALCEGELNGDALARLESLLLADDDACRYYLSYVKLHGLMMLGDRPAMSVAVDDVRSCIAASAPATPTAVPWIPQSTPPGSPLGAWQNAFGFFSAHEFFTGYLVATVLFAIATLITANVYLTHYQSAEYAKNHSISPAPMPVKHDYRPEIVSVARITGMVDCTWVNSDDAPFHDRVAQGTKFTLKSGLMEITYHTGARVILQGPCTYEVESTAGGYLSLGKLTARVETAKPRAAKQKSSFPLPPSALFAIRTPMATVSDLGTEFGVEVKADKSLDVCVFKGMVETTSKKGNGKPATKERLAAGEAIQYAANHSTPRRTTVAALRGVSMPSLKSTHAAMRIAKTAPLLVPNGIVASAYHHVVDKHGNLLADNNRGLAFQMATDDVFGRGEHDEGPRSGFDTAFEASGQWLEANEKQQGRNQSPALAASRQPLATSFVGLLYSDRVRLDRIKVFLGHQAGVGGSWRRMPRVFILAKSGDPGNTPPEDNPSVWRELPTQRIAYGNAFDDAPDANPGKPIEWVLTGYSEQERTGYGWAVGGAPGDGPAGYVSVTELRGYGAVSRKEKNK